MHAAQAYKELELLASNFSHISLLATYIHTLCPDVHGKQCIHLTVL